MRRLLAVSLLLWLSAAPAAAQRPAVVVTPGSAQTYRVALQTFADDSEAPRSADVTAYRVALADGLVYSGAFQIIDTAAFLGPVESTGLDDEEVLEDCDDWQQIGADALVDGALRLDGGRFHADLRVWDAARCTRLLTKRYQQASGADPVTLAKRMADDVLEAFVGYRGVVSTELTFISTRSGSTEVYVMDADGDRSRPATANHSINQSPDWSPSGDAIVYTSYRHLNRPFLFQSVRRGDRRPGRLLAPLGEEMQQYSGAFDPAGKRLAIVTSNDGPSEIHTVRPNGRGLRRLTNNRAIDVSPTWSPDGTQIAFVSDRAGAPNLYVMNADGSGARRLTYDGSYNTNPAWSPDGRWIAYDTRIGSQFDIWLIDPDGSVNVPLVTHPRSDEAPTWAPNSRKLAFSSNRRGRKDIYVIDVNGDNLRQITRDQGDNTSPSWGGFPP